MSIEDLNVSAIDADQAVTEFSSEFQADGQQAADIEMAQATDNGASAKSDRLPAEAAVVGDRPKEIVPDQNNIARLPANVTVDEIRVEGANLILVQADGTEVTIINGALRIPTFIIGEVEVPQQVLLAVLEQDGVNVAAGPDGSYSATSSGPQSSGGNFEDSLQQSTQEAGPLAELLANTEFGDPNGDGNGLLFDDTPIITETAVSFITEAANADGTFENQSIDGIFGFVPGADTGQIVSIAYVNTLNIDEPTQAGIATALTSGGVPVVVTVSADGLTLTGTAAGTVVFTLTVTNTATGAFTFQQLNALDHPDQGQSGAADLLRLQFTYTVSDKDGDTVIGNASIDIGDDGPVAATGTGSTVEDEAVNGGNNEADGFSAAVTGVSLNINWGADSANAGGLNDRSVAFTTATVGVSGASSTALTSLGLAVSTVLINGVLVGYTGETAPTSFTGEGSSNVVFYASVSDVANGTYDFTLVKPLDHAATQGENSLSLTFGYTATDSDGDTSSNTFTVNVIDDVPVANTGTSSTVEDEAVNGGNNEEADGFSAAVTGVSLNINWGSDNANLGGTNDRSVAFTNATVGVSGASSTALTSLGLAVATTVLADGTLVGYTGPTAPTALTGEGSGNLVFFAKVSDLANGSYDFTLVKPLDHAATQGENSLSLTFNYTATDSDGDTSSNTFTVNVIDDVPVASTGTSATVEDEAVNGGNNEADGFSAAVTGVSLNINWGSDNANAGGLNDRSVAFTNTTVAVSGAFGESLTSLGLAVKTVLIDGVLVGYTGETAPTSFTGEGSGNLVFFAKVSDLANGSYDFTLVKPLDHAATQGENSLSLTFNYTATDSDGDTSSNTFTVNVIDDAPVANTGTSATVEDEAVNGGNNEADGFSAAVTGVSLNINWGSDNANAGGTNDRSVAFTNATVGVSGASSTALTSLGLAVATTVLADGTLVGYTGPTAPTALTGEGSGNLVFFAKVSDLANGSYDFTLVKPLDHAATQGENSLSLTFNYTATDSDGDTSSNTFTVNVIDDVPVASTGTSATVEDEAVNGGNNEADGFSAAVTGVSLNINWGSDNANAGGLNDRSVAFTNTTVAVSGAFGESLTSLGLAVKTVLIDGVLVGYTGETAPTSFTGEGSGNLVFFAKVSDLANGSYDFTLVKPLDHAATQGENSLSLTFNYTATDSDGDTSSNTFTVNVIDDVPVRGEEVRGTVEDEAVNGGNNESDGLTAVATGALNIRWGADNADSDLGGNGDRSVAFTNTTVAVSGAHGAALTSLGQAVSTVLINGVLVGYTGATAPSAINGANVVFHAALSDDNSGSYTFTLVKPLDHAAGDGTNGENSLSLSFGYTAKDSDGDSVTGSFTVDVKDDVAKIGTPFAGGVVEEEQAEVAGNGNEDFGGSGDNDTLFNLGRTTHQTGGTLAISWGSDNANDGNGQPGDRSVQFGPAAVGNLNALNLTSDGDAIRYTTVTVSGQQILLAYTGAVAPTAVPVSSVAAIAANIVFSVALSDSGNGSYAFTLYDTLDHQGSVQGEDSQVLTFQFTATDSDGDITELPGTFSVRVIDDKPEAIGTLLPRFVEEEELSGGNEDRTSSNPLADLDSALFGNLTGKSANGPLNISWGGDDGNKLVNGGYTGTQIAGDLSVVFADGTGSARVLTATQAGEFLSISGGAGSVGLGSLTSAGHPITFSLSANGTVLTASADGQSVFTVTLSDTGSGSYEFNLTGVLDHPVKASGASNEDILSFTFTFTARDGDGDIVKSTFTVGVIDDVPVRGEEVRGAVEDEAVNGGNNETEAPNLTAVATGALNIRWGADNADSDLGGNGDRSVAFTNTTVAVSGAHGAALTSLGQAVSTVLINGVLVGYTGTVAQAPASINGTNVVFHAALSDDNSGSYTFTLVKPLDHAAGDGENGENSLSLSFGYTAKDSDGDSVTGSFTVDVKDDVAKIGTPFAGGVVEEEQAEVAGNGNEDFGGSGDNDTLFNLGRTTHQTGGTLAISWGSDNANDGNGQPGDRSVQFGPAAVGNLNALNLTSDGDAIRYTTVTVSGQQILLAYTGAVAPTAVPVSSVAAIAANIVFSVALSDSGNGSYAFTLYDTLDHQGSVQGEDSQVLTFQFTATDSDGDITELPGTFSVRVIDDKPEAIGTLLPRFVEEEELSGGNEDRTSSNPLADLDSALFGNLTGKSANGPLNISWGGDDGNKLVNGGYTGTQIAGDLSVVFADGTGSARVLTATQAGEFLSISGGAGSVGLGSLTSAGHPITFSLSANGTVLTASADGQSVFTVTLSDTGSGSYEFNLTGVLDHPVKASGASNEDILSFTFTFTARDGDGDIVKSTFTVGVIDDVPVRGEEVRGAVEDEAVNGGNNETEAPNLTAVATGALNIRWGADNADSDLGGNGDRSVAFTNTTVAVSGAHGAALTSLGQAVSTVLINGVLVGYTGTVAQAPASINGTNVVFHAALSDDNSGSYTFTLVKPLDHAAGDGENGENSLSLSFGYTAKDSDGDSVTGSFTVDVKDDVAKIGTPFAGGVVEEEQAEVAGNGNEDFGGSGDNDTLFNLGRTTHQTGGTLAISWGSDNANDGNGQPGDRSVQFGPAAVGNMNALNLTSDGDAIRYTTVTVSGQQILLAYTGAVAPTAVPANSAAAIAANIVFSVALSDSGNGSYAFTLYDTLDHQGSVQGEDSQVLTFQFTATDSDGDITAPASFSVRVIDDKPEAIGTLLPRFVEEEELSGGNEDRTSSNPLADLDSAVFGNVTGKSANGPLNISWGGDDGNKLVNGGYTGTQVAGDLSVVFADGTGSARVLTATQAGEFLSISGGAGSVGLGSLTSAGHPVTFSLSANGTVLTASADGQTVFTVTLSDTGSGSYEFNLTGVLDHPVKASGASNEDILSFTFTFTARDGDGDIVKSTFTVGVIDDVPVRGEEVRGTVEDEAVNGGNNESDGLTAVATGALNIRWGADNADSDLGGNGDRSVAFTNTTVAVSGAHGAALTSLGQAVSTVLINGVLVGYTGATAPSAINGTNVVFHAALSDDNSGSYTFTLVKPLDHAAGDGTNGENSLSLTFGYTAKDSDGDSVTGSFTVDVSDDTPEIGASEAGAITEDAVQVPLANASFEATSLAAGEPGVNVDYVKGNYTYGSPAGWTISGGTGGVFAPTAAIVTSTDHTGGNVVWLRDGATLAQDTGEIVGEGEIYTVRLNVADRTDQDWPGGEVRIVATDGVNTVILASQTLPAPANGTWTSVELNSPALTAAQALALAGYHIRVEVQQTSPLSGNQILVDNVELSTMPAMSDTGSLAINWGADNDPALRSVAFDAGLTNNSAAMTANGPLTSNGAAVLLVRISATELIGVADDDNNGVVDANGRVIFKVTLDDGAAATDKGSWTFKLLDNIDHSPAANDASLGLTFGFSATDSDGDTIGGKSFTIVLNDDSPVVVGSVTTGLTLNENDLPAGTDLSKEILSATGTLNIDMGADGGKRALSAAGATWDAGKSTLTAMDGSWKVALNGDGTYTFTLLKNTLLHGPNANNGTNPLDLTINYLATDGDGDTKGGSFTVGIVDDAPLIRGDAQTGTLSETGLPFVSSTFGSLNVDLGADKNGHVEIGLNGNGKPVINPGLTSDGVALEYLVRTTNGVDQELVAFKQGDPAGAANPVFIVAVLHNGSFAATLYQNIDHANGSDTLTLNMSARVYDGDGDYVDQSFKIDILDDLPTASYSGNVAVTEDASGMLFTPQSASGRFIFDGGADGAKVTSLAYGAGSNAIGIQAYDADAAGPGVTRVQLTSAGRPISVETSADGLTLTGKTATGVTVFTLHVDNALTGDYTFKQFAAIDHPDVNESGAADPLRMRINFTVTDGDGDQASGHIQVDLRDDAPVINGSAQSGNLSEAGLTSAGISIVSGSLNIDVGADYRNGHVSIGLDDNGDPIINAGLTSDGVALAYAVRTTNGVDQELVAFKVGDTAANPVFIVSVLHPANFVATLYQNVDHLGGNDTSLALNLSARVYDGDGDYVDRPFTINIADTVPVLVSGTSVSGDVAEATLALETQTFASGTVNLGIFDNSTTVSTITIPDGGTIRDVNISINLTHSWMSDLEITLIAPDGTRITLVNNQGGSGDPNGIMTFDDEAANAFSSAGQPFVGTWRPTASSLSLLDGKDMSGNWTLEIKDEVGFDTGMLRNWSLDIETLQPSNPESINVDLSSLVNVGADDVNGGAAFSLKTVATAENLAGIMAGGAQVQIVSDGTTLTGFAIGAPNAPLFTLKVSAAGTATFVLLGELDHGAGNDTLKLNLGAYVQAKDGDGDTITLGAGQFFVNVADSLPAATDVTASMGENESKTVTLIEGLHFNFGTDDTGTAFSFGTPSYTGLPSGVTLGTPAITFDTVNHKVSIVPGTAFDALAAGQTVVMHIPYTVADGDGDVVTKDIAITITGTNDIPVIDLSTTTAGNDTATNAVEQMPQQFAWQADLSDVDSPNLHSMTLTLGNIQDGIAETLSLNAAATAAAAGLNVSYNTTTGVMTITGTASVDRYETILKNTVYLNSSDNPHVATDRTVTVIVNDGIDNSAPQVATIHLIALNDAPVLAGPLADVVAEGASLTLTAAKLGYTDPDDGPAGVVFRVSNVAHGTITNGGAPATSFTAAELAAGLIKFNHDGSEGSSASFNVSVEDGNEDNSVPTVGTFNLTVTPVNDAPVIDLSTATAGNNTTTNAVEQMPQQFAWQADLSDVDSTTLQSMKLTLGNIQDGTAETLSLNATATAAAVGLSVSYNTATGVMTITGTAPINTYETILKNIVYLNSSDDPHVATDRTVTVIVNDGTDNSAPQVATIHLIALNDAPVLAGPLADTVAEGASLTLTAAKLGYSDPDDGPAGVVFRVSNVAHGTITNGGVPATSFTAAELAAGLIKFNHDGTEGPSASFNVSVEDGNEDNSVPTVGTFNLTVTPVNDAPVITGDRGLAVNEGATVAVTSTDLGFSDPDDTGTGVVFTVSNTVNGSVLVNNIVATSFTGQQLLDGLVSFRHNGSETTSASFGVSLEDGNEDNSAPATATINVIVTPVNDAPVITVEAGDKASESLVETNAGLSATGKLTVGDADGTDIVTAAVHSVSATGPTGGLSNAQLLGYLSLSGQPVLTAGETSDKLTWNFNSASQAFNFLAAGQTLTLSYVVRATDNSSGAAFDDQTVTVTIQGTNDAPTLLTVASATFTDTAVDNTFAPVAGTLSGADLDAGDNLTYGITGGAASNTLSGYNFAKTGAYGVLYLNTGSGAYTYVPNDGAIEGLKSNASDNFTFTVKDGAAATASQTFTVNITGANDTPTLTAVTSPTFTDTAVDNTFTPASGTLTGADRDAGETLTYGITSGSTSNALAGYNLAKSGTYGVLYLNTGSGAYTYVPNDGAIEGLKSSASDSFTVTVKDGANATSTQPFVVNITGANDTAVINGTSTGSVTEDGTLTASGTLSVADRDTGDGTFQAPSTLAGTYGTFTFNPASGAWGYTLNNAASNVQALNAGDVRHDTLTVTSIDGTATRTIDVTINGANDAPSLPTTRPQLNDSRDISSDGQLTTFNKNVTTGATGSAVLQILVRGDYSLGNSDEGFRVSVDGELLGHFRITSGGVVGNVANANVTAYSGGVVANNGSDDITWNVGITINSALFTALAANGSVQVRIDNDGDVDSFGVNTDFVGYRLVYNGGASDPIILDLDHNGIALTQLENGVTFDINADGAQDHVAWTAGSDGILAYDVDGNGKIDNGSEIFSPDFAGGKYIDGLAALATLDTNHDGKIDANDADFGKLLVWQDLNHNGISDQGELLSLTDHAITSLSLDATAANMEINGQSVLAQGSYSLADGSTGSFVEVAFDTSLGETGNLAGADYSLVGTAGDDILAGGLAHMTMTGGAGADTFVLDADAFKGIALADVIADYKDSEGDVLDVSSLLTSLLGHEASEADALANVKATVNGADTVVSVNDNGAWHDVAVLQDYTSTVKVLYDDDHNTTSASHSV